MMRTTVLLLLLLSMAPLRGQEPALNWLLPPDSAAVVPPGRLFSNMDYRQMGGLATMASPLAGVAGVSIAGLTCPTLRFCDPSGVGRLSLGTVALGASIAVTGALVTFIAADAIPEAQRPRLLPRVSRAAMLGSLVGTVPAGVISAAIVAWGNPAYAPYVFGAIQAAGAAASVALWERRRTWPKLGPSDGPKPLFEHRDYAAWAVFSPALGVAVGGLAAVLATVGCGPSGCRSGAGVAISAMAGATLGTVAGIRLGASSSFGDDPQRLLPDVVREATTGAVLGIVPGLLLARGASATGTGLPLEPFAFVIGQSLSAAGFTAWQFRDSLELTAPEKVHPW